MGKWDEPGKTIHQRSCRHTYPDVKLMNVPVCELGFPRVLIVKCIACGLEVEYFPMYNKKGEDTDNG